MLLHWHLLKKHHKEIFTTGRKCFGRRHLWGGSYCQYRIESYYGRQTGEKAEKENKKLENVAIKGKVADVCEKKGCWLTIQTDDNSQFFVKMKDYAFFVPTALKGKNVVLEGNAERKVISVDEQKHYAEDAKKPQSEIDAITQPKEEIRFLASGIKVVN